MAQVLKIPYDLIDADDLSFILSVFLSRLMETSMQEFSDIHEFLRIEIKGSAEPHYYDPVMLITQCVDDPDFLTNLESDGAKSIISGEPGLHYTTNEVELVLTGDEIYRLTMRSLTVQEYFALIAKDQMFFEIHEDFYDPRTGQALQPKI